MKFTITLKDPDGFFECVEDAAKEEINKIKGLDKEEKLVLTESKVEKINDFLSKWVEFQEYITIEFDTEAGTAIVQEN